MIRALRRADAGLPVDRYWLGRAARFEMQHMLLTRTNLTKADIEEMPHHEVKMHCDMLLRKPSESSEG